MAEKGSAKALQKGAEPNARLASAHRTIGWVKAVRTGPCLVQSGACSRQLPLRAKRYGLGGDDHLQGGPGDDYLAGDAGDDILDGADGQDDLRGGEGANQLFGGPMADNLMGENGNDYLSGGAGHDMLDGGTGDDIYNGGNGADAFIVAHGTGDDIVIGGFDAGPEAFDHIAFTDVLPNEITVVEAASPYDAGHPGVLVSWGGGSIFLGGISKSQLAQDDFMFNAIEGGAFVPDPELSNEGSNPLFGSGQLDWLV